MRPSSSPAPSPPPVAPATGFFRPAPASCGEFPSGPLRHHLFFDPLCVFLCHGYMRRGVVSTFLTSDLTLISKPPPVRAGECPSGPLRHHLFFDPLCVFFYCE